MARRQKLTELAKWYRIRADLLSLQSTECTCTFDVLTVRQHQAITTLVQYHRISTLGNYTKPQTSA
jgi:hypothetical protein